MKRKAFIFCSFLSLVFSAEAQTIIPLNDLSTFQTPAANWRIAGDVSADLAKNGEMNVSKGTGILVNLPEKKEAKDLVTNFQHGDLDLELDYMMAKGSNSGIYLQGRYEIQLLDSWGIKNPKPGDNGGIYERWDDNKPEGKRGFEGTAPRQNASKAPGLWQHIKISFQAPRFDTDGNKIENAKVIRVELNGVPIQENVDLSGPTRGAMGNNEVAIGPLRFQGDHGHVAFRNLIIKNYDKPRPELKDLNYTIFKGKFEKEPDLSKLPPEAKGTTTILSSTVNKIPNDFLIRYTGKLNVKEAGLYNFDLSVPGGTGLLKINNQIIIPINQTKSNNVNLPAGLLAFELLYSKFVSWTNPALGLTVSGDGVREYLISDVNNSTNEVIDPILISAATNTILRSFIDIPGGKRVVHAVSVGTPQQIHYTYDLDNGMMIQAWRGDFLDATSMWHGRGDGSSRPMGAVQYFGMPRFTLAKLASPETAWPLDSTGTGFFTKGYILNENDLPTFRYHIYNSMVSDAIMPLENGQGLQRKLTLQNPDDNLYVRIANGKNIELIAKGMYLVDDKSYYLRIDDAGNATPIIKEVDGQKELIIPIQGALIYSIIF